MYNKTKMSNKTFSRCHQRETFFYKKLKLLHRTNLATVVSLTTVLIICLEYMTQYAVYFTVPGLFS